MNKKLTLAAIAAAASLASAGVAVSPSFAWDGTDVTGKVETGSDAETSGYWYKYDDNAAPNNGDSQLIFPSDVEPDEYENFFGPLCDKYGGIKASVALGSAYDYPFVGLGFNIVSEDQEGADITAWGGICLTYSSTTAFDIELGVENEAEVTEYNNYKAPVPKSPTVTTSNFAWTQFKQEANWGVKVDQAVVLSKTAAIKLKFSKADGDFIIQAIGSLSKCNGAAIASQAKAASLKAQLSGRTLSFGKSVAAEIVNLQGQVVKSGVGASMDLSKLQAGVYMVRAEGLSQKVLLK